MWTFFEAVERGSGGVTPGKFLVFYMQIGGIWCILDAESRLIVDRIKHYISSEKVDILELEIYNVHKLSVLNKLKNKLHYIKKYSTFFQAHIEADIQRIFLYMARKTMNQGCTSNIQMKKFINN